MNNLTNYFKVLFESLTGKTQQTLNWYEEQLDMAYKYIDNLYATSAKQKSTKKTEVKSTTKKPVVKKTTVKKTTKSSGN